MVFSKLLALSLLLFFYTPSVVSSVVNENRFRNGQTKSGFALMEVKDVGEEKAAMELCVNFQQFEKRPVPEGPFHLVWWDSSPGLTTVCGPPTKGQKFEGNNELLPLDYITNIFELYELCRQNNPDWMLKGGPVEFQVSNAENAGIKTILFLMPRSEGKNAINLHSKFCNAEINERAQDNGTNIFYIYDEVFDQQLVPKLRASQDSLELRFRRPSHGFDLGLPLLWLLCLVAVALGSIWSAKAATARLERKSTKRRQQQQISGNQGAIDSETAEMEAANKEKKKKKSCLSTTLIVAFVIIGIICLIYVGHLLGTYGQILLTCLLWTAFGIFCMAKCLFALCKYVLCPKRYGQQKPFFKFRRIRLTGLGLLCYLLSAAICLPWPFVLSHPWSFVLLDLMGVAIVAYLIKYLSYEGLKKKKSWSARGQLILTTIMFACGILWFFLMHSAKTSKCEPKAPIGSVNENEMFGNLIMPILNDPLTACQDAQNPHFRFIFIQFASIIFSAAVSVPFWFHVDFVNGRRFPYGFAALFGYSLGLLSNLFFMMYFNSLNWLLAYLLLMPWSIYAVLILALVKGTFKQLLKGEMISADHQIN